MNVSIYALVDPETQRVHYVGQAQFPQIRYRVHVLEAPNALPTFCRPELLYSKKQIWLCGLAQKGKAPKLVILEEVEDAQSEERERYWIAEMKQRGEPLTNVQPGRSHKRKQTT